jgi:hypothetical protein
MFNSDKIQKSARQYTNKLLEMVENGLLDKDQVILACVKYMSEDDVAEMMRINEMLIDAEEDNDEEEDDLDDLEEELDEEEDYLE